MVVQLGQIPVLCNILVATLLADNPLSRNAGEFKPLNAILGSAKITQTLLILALYK